MGSVKQTSKKKHHHLRSLAAKCFKKFRFTNLDTLNNAVFLISNINPLYSPGIIKLSFKVNLLYACFSSFHKLDSPIIILSFGISYTHHDVKLMSNTQNTSIYRSINAILGLV